jgi:hypothetical protein
VRVSSSAFTLTRRNLLVALGAGMIADSASAAPAALPARRRRPAREMGLAGMEDWAAFIGERFGLGAGVGAGLRLVAVQPASSGGATSAADRRPFTMLFEATGTAAPEGDCVYRLSHPAMASLPVFLGPRVSSLGKARFVAEFG